MHVLTVYVLSVNQYLSLKPCTWYQVVHPVEQPQESGLAAARRTDEGDHLILRNLHRDAFKGMEVPVVEIDVFGFDFFH